MSLDDRLRAASLDWIVPTWTVPANVGAFATTRQGGVSTGPRASFDVGSAASEDPDVIENRRRLGAFLPADPHWLHQVHGATVVTLNRAVAATPPNADAAVTADRDVVCAVRTADCLPVLLADRDGACVGAAHAGWRGLAAGVLEATVRALGVLGARRLVAWIGPGIGPQAFEVGPEVRAAFCDQDDAAATCFRPGVPGKWFADLPALATSRLARAGVEAVIASGLCTYSDPARFFSYRRDRDTGRMAALVWRH